MALAGPVPLRHTSPFAVILDDLRDERSAAVPFPPGETSLSVARTRRFAGEPLAMLLESYERFGPVFTLRLAHGNTVFMLGPAANHYITVSHASNFLWRESHYRDLIGLLGDGLLTIDRDFHHSSRRVMLPAFQHDRLAGVVDVIIQEADRALEQLTPGLPLDVYAWTRTLAIRVAMRALLGLDPDGERARSVDAAGLFERALSYYATEFVLRTLRGPLTPWARMQKAARQLDALIYSEIAARRAARASNGGRREDILSLLIDAEDDDGTRLSDRQVRDEVMTLMFAGHDTTTSTVAFMFYELARNTEILSRLLAEQDDQLPEGRPTASQLLGGELELLEMVLDETLRKYPPAWVGPRRSIQPFEFEGIPVPGRAFVDYCSWASHHLPEVFPDPDEFRPERFMRDARAALPKGAYVPFGGGPRTCIGMRFGQLEVRTIATAILSRFTFSLPEDFELDIRQMPTISPKHGLPMFVGPRTAPLSSPLPTTA
jgi:cytochrome P450